MLLLLGSRRVTRACAGCDPCGVSAATFEPVMERTGRFRKVRFARPSRREGKSGGARVIFYFLERRDRIYLLLAYSKTVKDDLTRAEGNELRRLGRELEGEEP